MESIEAYLLLFGVVIVVGQLFNRSTIPVALLLVITGMLLSFFPFIPRLDLSPTLVLNVFLPLLVYEISAYSSWGDFKKNIRPIALLSVGHVIFIALLIAIVIHALLPELGWPLAFVLGAIISPPDSVAIVSIAEKIRMPQRIVTILQGEGLLNDATALILFRFALAAVITHQFSAVHAAGAFLAVIIGETVYGLIVGHLMGEIRLRLNTPVLNVMASLLTPFLAYLPAEKLGGSGVLATVVAGFVIGHRYALRFTPEFRLISRALWPALAFAIQGILFLWVGLNMRYTLENIALIPAKLLLLYSLAVILTVIIGRFIWVYMMGRFLVHPFVISWAGMRGAISLAAALAVPALPAVAGGVNPRDLLIFLVFCVITATLLLQGLTLPRVLKMIGLHKHGECEQYHEHLAELSARLQMTKAVLRWLVDYKEQINDPKLLDEIKLHRREYRMLKTHLKERISNHNDNTIHDEKAEIMSETVILLQLIEIERTKLLQLWQSEKINLTVRNRLLERLDHRSKNIS